ncbi:MAG TPA: peptide chain release factor N(5)-glutamine methyltransferase [Candidatus Dormibacteraeota bacterium]|nr:peptide chain release factor N(5)-glutamine methyltransferase [Candidatus Dormibacteraeota bacterium]
MSSVGSETDRSGAAVSPPTTRGEARAAAIARLRAARIETAALDADLLLAFALGIRKEDVYAHPEPALAPDDLARYAALVDRRSRGEPVAYLRGVKEFYGLEFAVDRRVLIPRPETELLADEAIRRLSARASPLIADLGTGSGAIAIALARALPGARVIATDASVAALEVARANAARHGVAARIDFRAGDLLEPVREPVDAVVANLPYLRTDEVNAARGTSIEFEPRAALDGGHDGLDVIRRAIEQLAERVARPALALFECAPQQADVIAARLAAARFSAEIVADLAGRERVVVGIAG